MRGRNRGLKALFVLMIVLALCPDAKALTKTRTHTGFADAAIATDEDAVKLRKQTQMDLSAASETAASEFASLNNDFQKSTYERLAIDNESQEQDAPETIASTGKN